MGSESKWSLAHYFKNLKGNNVNVENSDQSGRNVINSIFGEGIVGNVEVVFSSLFCYQGDTRKLQSILNGGTVSLADSMLKVNSGTGATSSAIASSRRSLSYKALKEGFAGFTAMFKNPVDNNKRYVGIIDDLNGFAVGMNGTKFSIFYKNNGSFVDIIPQENFNIDKLDGTGYEKFILNPEKLNIFRISYGYLGVAPITFEIFVNSKWIPFHRLSFANISETPHIRIPYLKFRAYNVNEGNTINVELASGSIAVGVIGTKDDEDVSSRDFTLSIPETTIAGASKRILLLHTKASYGGIENRVETLANLISGATDLNKSATLKRYRLTTTPTITTFQNVSVNSFMEYTTNATELASINLAGAEIGMPMEFGKVGNIFETDKIRSLNMRMLPDEYVVYVLETTGTGTFNLSVGWKELH